MPQQNSKKFKILPHTADVRLLIFGSSFEEIFKNALLGMAQILKPTEMKNKTISQKIKIKSLDPPALLIDFLSEILYLSTTNKAIYKELKIEVVTPTSIEAEIKGVKVKSFGEDIKGVTYHESYFQQKSENVWEALVIFDI